MPGFDAVLKFRCHLEFVRRFERLAKQHRRDVADLLRLAVEDYVQAEEKRFDLQPITPEEMHSYLKAAEKYEKHQPPVRPAKPARYPSLQRRARDHKK